MEFDGLEYVQFSYTRHEGNMLARDLIKNRLTHLNVCIWLSDFSDYVARLGIFDHRLIFNEIFSKK